MVTLTSGVRPQAFILSEANGQRSRENGIVASGEGVLPAGTIVNGTPDAMTALAAADTDPIGIIMYNVDATDADVAVSYIARDAEVNLKVLELPAGVTGPQLIAIRAALDELGILTRD